MELRRREYKCKIRRARLRHGQHYSWGRDPTSAPFPADLASSVWRFIRDNLFLTVSEINYASMVVRRSCFWLIGVRRAFHTMEQRDYIVYRESDIVSSAPNLILVRHSSTQHTPIQSRHCEGNSRFRAIFQRKCHSGNARMAAESWICGKALRPSTVTCFQCHRED